MVIISRTAYLEAAADNIQPNHLWPASFSFTLRTALVEVVNTVFSTFCFRLASPKNYTTVSSNVMISWENLADIKILFANRQPKSISKPSPKSHPNKQVSAHARHFDIAHWGTEENTLGLSMHPCRTLALIWKVRLFPPCPVTFPCQ